MAGIGQKLGGIRVHRCGDHGGDAEEDSKVVGSQGASLRRKGDGGGS